MASRMIVNSPLLALGALGMLVASSMLVAPLAQAQQLDPPNLGITPPDVTSGVTPNVLLTFDNSGSMAYQYIPDSASSTSRKRFYASEWNRIYYNPNVTYLPALLPDATSMDTKTVTTYTAALKDGVCTNRPAGGTTSCSDGQSGSVNLKTNFDSTYGSGARTASAQASGSVDGFYMVNSNTASCALTASNPNPADNCYSIVKMSTQSTAQQKNFAIWYSYYRFRNLMARTGISRSFATLNGNLRVAWQNIGRDSSPNTTLLNDGTASTISTFGGSLRTNFFNWLYANSADINTPNRASLVRGGQFFAQGAGVTNNTNPYWDSTLKKELTCRQNFHLLVTDGYWNEQNPSMSSTLNPVDASAIGADSDPSKLQTSGQLPDATAYDPTASVSKIYGNEKARTNNGCSNTAASSGSVPCAPTIADITWYFWSHDLRTDLTNNVPPYFPDLTTGITAVTPSSPITNPATVPEIYWNPSNDPATWQHVVQYIIGLGVPGTLQVPSSSPPAEGATGAALGDYTNLRTGAVQWPQLINNDPTGLDDTWHATINGRGGYFNASSPQELTSALANVLDGIAARTISSSAGAVSGSILSQTTTGYSPGYNSNGWSGFLYQFALDGTTGAATLTNWDAGCILSGGAFTPVAPSGGNPPKGLCKVPTPLPAAPTRIIFTATTAGSALKGVPFLWSSLGSTEQGYLNLDPNTTNPDLSSGFVTGTSDGNGTDRVNYLRGDRTNESTPTSETSPRLFRKRQSLLGAIINSQTQYEAGPAGGYADIFPAGSPEETAAEPCITDPLGLSAPTCASYERFVNDNLTRPPLIYVGANDGMMHAFDAATGNEQWAFVPNLLYRNGQLAQTTNPANGLVPTVDDTPVIKDVFISTPTDATAKWRTILIGSMRLGGRGIYALDVTDQTKPTTDAAAASKFMWEFTNANDPDLGYSYASTNVARLHNGKWVVLVTSGYFPSFQPGRSVTYPTGAPDNNPAATADVSHLWVLDASTGAVIRKLNTKTGVISFGLSTPNVVDFGQDQIDDVSVAGDLAGNLWRFDLSDSNPSNWTVDQMFQTYPAGTTTKCSSTNTTGIGCEPISVQVQTFADRAIGGSAIFVFGSGKYLDKSDKPSASVLTTQHFFGVRDYGAGSTKYPLHESDLVAQTITESGVTRTINANPIPLTKAGWMIPLNVDGGERVVIKATPIYAVGAAVLGSLISADSGDPCFIGRVGAIMVVDASTGGPLTSVANSSGTPNYVGVQVNNPPTVGGVPVLLGQGTGDVYISGVGVLGGGTGALKVTGLLPIWRRTSWRELLNNL